MAATEIQDDNFNEIPIDALNVSVRLRLNNMLNPELPLFERDKYARDFRGVAELMGFGNTDIMNFQRNSNPMMQVLNAWGKSHTVGQFLTILEEIKRFDVIHDLKPQIVENCNLYRSSRLSQPLQDCEVTSCLDNVFPPDNPDHLTIYDTCDRLATFDAYICYADSDIKFVKWLVKNLEAPPTGIKLCVRDRDLKCGAFEYDAFARMIQERCHRILIVLTPEFLNSPECEFQAKYASGLACEHRNRRLIPILYKPCEMPAILKYISKVDFSRQDIQEWIWMKLIHSIKNPATDLFVPANTSENAPPNFESFQPTTETSSSPLPVLPEVPNGNISFDIPSTSTETETLYPKLSKVALTESMSGSKSKKQKIVQTLRNFISSPSSSSGSSGFHSQSDA